MQVAYFSDLHLDVKGESIYKKIETFMKANDLQKAFVTGDISNGIQITYHLKQLSKVIPEVYFILGNHCYYFSSIFRVEDEIQNLTPVYSNLHWLTGLPPIELDSNTALIGSEGWTCSKSGIERLSLESLVVEEFRNLSFEEFQLFKNTILEYKFKQASRRYKNVICLTHFPPVWNANKFLDFYFKRYNVNSGLKHILDKQDLNIKVYSGHTHNNYSYFGKKWQCHTINPSYKELNQKNIITI